MVDLKHVHWFNLHSFVSAQHGWIKKVFTREAKSDSFCVELSTEMANRQVRHQSDAGIPLIFDRSQTCCGRTRHLCSIMNKIDSI